ncbi:hypothetical protein F2P81_018135 [Scophthalmus maximus]|uniref:Uncharacterized protein n=1 Tax=Scophthalmus maximus TaxID=52904 RepID=A0A6A4SBE0_SCOMX|nr:hypothetical protein F2P81_018135 [Scophthalmus maximus]
MSCVLPLKICSEYIVHLTTTFLDNISSSAQLVGPHLTSLVPTTYYPLRRDPFEENASKESSQHEWDVGGSEKKSDHKFTDRDLNFQSISFYPG